MPNRGKFIGNDNLYVPDAPTIGTATAGDAQVSVTFTAPSDVGNDDITGFIATAFTGSTAVGATGTSSPISITGLSNGSSYTVAVSAVNDYGTGPLSSVSSSATPSAPTAFFCTGSGGDLNKRLIASLGNATDNGNIILHEARSGIASATRGIFTSGKTIGSADPSTKIRYFTIATGGGLSVFGDLSVATRMGFGVASSTRGITAGGFDVNSGTGQPGNVNHISYVTIASTGDASDFGDLTAVGGLSGGGCSSTRAVFMGRFTTGSSANTIDYITIASAGNASDFGDMPGTRKVAAGASNSTRAITAGPDGNEIEYVTIASTGNAADFGNLTKNNEGGAGAASSTRMLIAGGQGFSDEIDYITIASLGNASDFGDLTAATQPGSGGLSNAHGGLA